MPFRNIAFPDFRLSKQKQGGSKRKIIVILPPYHVSKIQHQVQLCVFRKCAFDYFQKVDFVRIVFYVLSLQYAEHFTNLFYLLFKYGILLLFHLICYEYVINVYFKEFGNLNQTFYIGLVAVSAPFRYSGLVFAELFG